MKAPQCITIAPGGYLGLYMLGTLCYMKNNYDTSKYHFGGASVGAILSMYMLSSKSDAYIFDNVMRPLICEFDEMKWSHLLTKTRLHLSSITDSVDRDRIFLGATKIQPNFPWLERDIKTHFDDKDDMLDYAIASSFVPFLTGFPATQYDTSLYIDGAFTENNPIPHGFEQVMFISPRMWGRNFSVYDCLQIDKTKALTMMYTGYKDAHENQESILMPRLPRWQRWIRKMKIHRLVWKAIR